MIKPISISILSVALLCGLTAPTQISAADVTSGNSVFYMKGDRIGLAPDADAGARSFWDSCYVRGQLGLNFLPTTEANVSGPGGAVSGDVSFGPGFALGVEAGYAINSNVSVEFDTGLNYNGVEGTHSDVTLTQMPFLANVVLRLSNGGALVPEVGVGGGGVASVARFSNVSVAGSTVLNDSDTQLVPAAQFFVSFNYYFTERVSMGAGYRMLWTDSPVWELDDVEVELDLILNHSLLLNFGVAF